MNNFFRIMMAASSFIAWVQRASADGVIDEKEVVEVVTMILNALNVKAEIRLKPIVLDMEMERKPD